MINKKIPGVQNSVVNLTTEKLIITVDDDVVTSAEIKRVVEKGGYKLKREEEIKKEFKKKSEKDKVLIRLILSAVFTVPL